MFSVHICAFLVVLSLFLSDACTSIQLAKMFKYMGGTLSCDILFGLFMVAWFITRHILFMLATMSTYLDVRNLPYKWDPPNGHYVTNNIYISFIVLLGLLQVRSTSFLRYLWSLTHFPLGAPTGLVLDDFEGCLQSYIWKRSGGCSE